MKSEYTEFILNSTKIIMKSQSAQEFVDSFVFLFKENFGISNMDFYTLDYNTGMFRDFVRDWIYVEDKEQQKYIYNIFNVFKENANQFILNGKVSLYNLEDNQIEELKEVGSKEQNVVYFPLFSPTRTFGFVEITYEKLNENLIIDKNFFKSLEIVFLQISTAIYNHVIKEHMATGLNFYDAMKNIAKIIENQYELEYIVPQIGEMVDRFISSHLIYLFLKDEKNNYKLLWPTNCNNEEILSMLQNQTEDKVKISSDHRIGVFPIQGEGKTLGALVAYSTIGKLSANEIEYLIELTKQSGITIQRANVYSEVLKHATMDALTGLNNRRQFEIRLKQETSQSVRKNTNLCGLMLDIDYFKKVNDTYGHAAGDCVLKGVAEIITKTVREYDIPCRYGGEEFFILLPMTTLEETLSVAERLRRNIQNAQIDIRAAKLKGISTLQVTASIGVNIFDKVETAEEFYHGADKALYESKINGRNRVTSYKSIKTSDEVKE